MKSVEELDVFKLAHNLALEIYRVTSEFPKEESFHLSMQMRRAASSVGMNLAEGSMRFNSREYRQYVGIARGSAAEVRYQLLLAKDLGYISDDCFNDIRLAYNRVGQMLIRLGQSLNHKPRSQTRAPS